MASSGCWLHSGAPLEGQSGPRLSRGSLDQGSPGAIWTKTLQGQSRPRLWWSQMQWGMKQVYGGFSESPGLLGGGGART